MFCTICRIYLFYRPTTIYNSKIELGSSCTIVILRVLRSTATMMKMASINKMSIYCQPPFIASPQKK